MSPAPTDTDARSLQAVLEAAAVNGGAGTAAELLPLVYDELRRVARAQLARGGPGQTLQATALVHEAWLRVAGDEDPGWDCRAHFFGAAARAMRHLLVEQQRKKRRIKRDAGRVPLELVGDVSIEPGTPVDDLLVLDEALTRLEEQDELKARIVMLRFFTGQTMAGVADTLGLPLTRVEREWRFARAWLAREMSTDRRG